MAERSEAEPNPRILAELAALADGSLAAERADEVRARITSSPELAERYERERRAVFALHELRAERAPAALRFAIEERRLRAPARRGRVLSGGFLAAATAVAVALIVLLLPGSPGAPAVSQAATLALRGPNPALLTPGPNPKDHQLLAVDVQETYFPNWKDWFGWRATGQRTDRLDGKLAITVYYQRGQRQIAYTILAAPPLPRPGSRLVHADGIKLQSFTSHGRLVVTWRRDGHTCLLSGAGVAMHELMALAGWKAP
jgi:hypothetical protein